MTDDILKAVPEDLRDTYDYVVVQHGACELGLVNDARMIARVHTLGGALVALKEQRPDIKVTIKMPVPREKPWRELPALMIGHRAPPGVYVRLDNQERANLMVLLKACGYRTNGIEPFTFMRGRGWLGGLGDKIEGSPRSDEPIDESAGDMTFEELAEKVREWRRG
jgi:hypothetical protein